MHIVAEKVRPEYVERYRSGHNEAVLKTDSPRGRVGSNPTLSALTRGAGNSVMEFPALYVLQIAGAGAYID